MEIEEVREAVLYALDIAERWDRGRQTGRAPAVLTELDIEFLGQLIKSATWRREKEGTFARTGSKSLVRLRHAVAIELVSLLPSVLERKPVEGAIDGIVSDVAEIIATTKEQGGLYSEVASLSVHAEHEAAAFVALLERYKSGLIETHRRNTAQRKVRVQLLQLFLADSGSTKSGLDGPKGAAIRIAASVTGDSAKTIRNIIRWADKDPRFRSGGVKNTASRMTSASAPPIGSDAFVNPGKLPKVDWVIQHVFRVLLKRPDHLARALVRGALRQSGPWPRRELTAEETSPMSHASEMLGTRIKAMREATGVSLEQLDFAAGIGAHVIQDIESGIEDATVSEVFALANAFGTTAASLLEEHEEGQLEALVARAGEITIFGVSTWASTGADADTDEE